MRPEELTPLRDLETMEFGHFGPRGTGRGRGDDTAAWLGWGAKRLAHEVRMRAQHSATISSPGGGALPEPVRRSAQDGCDELLPELFRSAWRQRCATLGFSRQMHIRASLWDRRQTGSSEWRATSFSSAAFPAEVLLDNAGCWSSSDVATREVRSKASRLRATPGLPIWRPYEQITYVSLDVHKFRPLCQLEAGAESVRKPPSLHQSVLQATATHQSHKAEKVRLHVSIRSRTASYPATALPIDDLSGLA